MASYLDKVQVNTAITENTKLDLGHQSIMSADFMQLNVATIHELVPGSKIDVNMESFARLNPLPVPTFGRAGMRNRAFFVPFRTIFRGWNDFITDAVHIASDDYSGGGSLLSSVPTISMEALRDAFLNSVGTDSVSDSMLYPVTTPNCDVYIDANNAFNFTVRGRQCIKLLEQLGYKVDWETKDTTVVFSALPLLALAKIYCDWYFPQQYSNISVYDRLLSLCNKDVHNGPAVLTSADVIVILFATSYVQYDSDLFVSAWDQPNQPAAGNYSDFKLVNIDSLERVYYRLPNSQSLGSFYPDNAGFVSNDSSTTLNSSNLMSGANAPFISPVVYGTSNFATNKEGVIPSPISQYLLHSLHALTDYMKRHQLAGSRAMDRYLARFGKALPAEKMNRSLYLGAAMQDIQIGDVTATSDTEGAQLGAFAGKGISYGNGHFDYQTDEFGYFIIISSIVPATGYFQGVDPQVQRVSKLSFFTPEFDSLGVEPIAAANLYIPTVGGQMSGNPYSQVFGFVPRYASYKCPTCSDRLTGNFRLRSLNGGSIVNAADSWHLMRTFDSDDFSGSFANVVHNPDFISGAGDINQYKRIFYNGLLEDAPDNFTIIHNFEIAEYAPMKALYDEYEFEDKGSKVTLDVNGVKKN